MASFVYNKGMELILVGGGGNIHAMLMRTDYPSNRDHQNVFDIAGWEINVGGYFRQAVPGVTCITDHQQDRSIIDAQDMVFPGLAAGQTIGYVVLYQLSGADTISFLLSLHAVTPTPTGGDFAITWKPPSEGGIILAISPLT